MHQRTYHIVYTGIFAVLLAICSWIALPTMIPFTLQTFGVFLTLLLLGGRQGTIAIAIYLLLGIVGIPVFSNFAAGAGYLLGNTGGYAMGFLLIGLIYRLFEKISGQKTIFKSISLLLGLIICYAFGTLWFLLISMNAGSSYSFMTVLSMCVLPFILPDLCKLFFAFALSRRLKPLLKTDDRKSMHFKKI